jgi:hypothetical protein
VVGFLATAFLVVDVLGAVFATGFLADNLTSEFLATLAKADLRREAVFFLIKPFLTAESISL